MNDLMNYPSRALENGRKKLRELRLEEQRNLEEQKRKEEELLEFMRMRFDDSLNQLFGDMAQFIIRPEKIKPGFQFLEISHPGCIPIRCHVYIRNDGSFESLRELKYTVPGIRTLMPLFDVEENEWFDGDIDINYGDARHDEGMETQSFNDLELALAIAEERLRYVEQQRDCIRKKYEELEKIYFQSKTVENEPVYEPLENSIESLINIAELVRLVRGIVDEALEERNA